jgi:hypothetical protein
MDTASLARTFEPFQQRKSERERGFGLSTVFDSDAWHRVSRALIARLSRCASLRAAHDAPARAVNGLILVADDRDGRHDMAEQILNTPGCACARTRRVLTTASSSGCSFTALPHDSRNTHKLARSKRAPLRDHQSHPGALSDRFQLREGTTTPKPHRKERNHIFLQSHAKARKPEGKAPTRSRFSNYEAHKFIRRASRPSCAAARSSPDIPASDAVPDPATPDHSPVG